MDSAQAPPSNVFSLGGRPSPKCEKVSYDAKRRCMIKRRGPEELNERKPMSTAVLFRGYLETGAHVWKTSGLARAGAASEPRHRQCQLPPAVGPGVRGGTAAGAAPRGGQRFEAFRKAHLVQFAILATACVQRYSPPGSMYVNIQDLF